MTTAGRPVAGWSLNGPDTGGGEAPSTLAGGHALASVACGAPEIASQPESWSSGGGQTSDGPAGAGPASTRDFAAAPPRDGSAVLDERLLSATPAGSSGGTSSQADARADVVLGSLREGARVKHGVWTARV